MAPGQWDHRAEASHRGRQAEEALAGLFKRAGWKVQRRPGKGRPLADFLVNKGSAAFVVEVKAGSEGRSDRLIPLWSQASLQAAHAAEAGHRLPLAVVAVPQVSPGIADQVLRFGEKFAPNVAAGVIDFAGFSRFRGPGLEGLNSLDRGLESSSPKRQSGSADLFSDLNQWMLKVILAPEIPAHLLGAPRGVYRNASELAKGAGVSVMSAFRLVQQLEREGYLHESSSPLNLVRREDLFLRWQAAASRRIKEMPMRFLLRSSPDAELRRILSGAEACLALFAAADALGLGFVRGVPPYVYVRRLHSPPAVTWKNLIPIRQGESPDIFIRQAPAPHSVFRGQVHSGQGPACDVLQVWLDVSSHPSRGREQAGVIRDKVLRRVMSGRPNG